MKRRNDIIRDLDSAGTALLKAARPSADEIESIASRPNLYESILAKIDASEPASVRVIHENRSVIYSLRTAGVFAFGVVLLFVLSSFFSSTESNGPRSLVVKDTQPVRKSEPQPQQPYIADEIVEPIRPARFERRASRISYRSDVPVKRKPVRRIKEPIESANAGDFYPVSFTGDPRELALGGRVVRVELSRASLFAMGINVPLENDSDIIRTDLLIGSDGVTRAIRLVE